MMISYLSTENNYLNKNMWTYVSPSDGFNIKYEINSKYLIHFINWYITIFRCPATLSSSLTHAKFKGCGFLDWQLSKREVNL